MIQAYPSPKYYRLFKAYVKANEMKDAEAAALMIRSFFNNNTNVSKKEIPKLNGKTQDKDLPPTACA